MVKQFEGHRKQGGCLVLCEGTRLTWSWVIPLTSSIIANFDLKVLMTATTGHCSSGSTITSGAVCDAGCMEGLIYLIKLSPNLEVFSVDFTEIQGDELYRFLSMGTEDIYIYIYIYGVRKQYRTKLCFD